MKYLIMVVIAICVLGCGGGSGSDNVTEVNEVLVIKDFNSSNSENRINIFLSMGQSNSVGFETTEEVNLSNVFMPEQGVYEYPSAITLKQFSNTGINKGYADNRTLVNTAVKFAQEYNSTIPLIVVNIAVEGIGINTGHRKWDLWSPSRLDDDSKSLHPQTIHYLQTLFSQLQAQGLEPYVVGFDWNQWEAENKNDSAYNYFDTYSKFFETITNVIPNKDFKLFICAPESYYFSHTDVIKEGFELLKDDRLNTYIYSTASFSSNPWRDEIKVHYTEEVHEGIASFVLSTL